MQSVSSKAKYIPPHKRKTKTNISTNKPTNEFKQTDLCFNEIVLLKTFFSTNFPEVLYKIFRGYIECNDELGCALTAIECVNEYDYDPKSNEYKIIFNKIFASDMIYLTIESLITNVRNNRFKKIWCDINYITKNKNPALLTLVCTYAKYIKKPKFIQTFIQTSSFLNPLKVYHIEGFIDTNPDPEYDVLRFEEIKTQIIFATGCQHERKDIYGNYIPGSIIDFLAVDGSVYSCNSSDCIEDIRKYFDELKK